MLKTVWDRLKSLSHKLKIRLGSEETGTVIVLVAVAFSVLMGFLALTVDTGRLYLERVRITRAMDAAALAGAQELPDTTQAINQARAYAQLNGIDPNAITVTFANSNRQISVTASRNVNLHFANMLGFSSRTVRGSAVAKVAGVSGLTGLVPVGVNESLLPMTPGNQYMLKGGSQDGNPWRGILGFEDSNSANDYREWTKYGYPDNISIGDYIDQANGNKSGPTEEGVNYRITGHTGCTWNNHETACPRLVYVPVYRVDGNRVQVVSFASMFLEPVTGSGNESRIFGRYVKVFAQSGTTSDAVTNSYLNVVKLSQ